MKKIFLLFLVCSSTLYSSAQLFSIKEIIDYIMEEEGYTPILGEEFANGSTFTISKLNAGELAGNVVLTNTSDRDINIGIKVVREKLTKGSVEQFCLNICYSSNGAKEQTYPSNGQVIIKSGEEKEISFHCIPGEAGENIANYEFYDREDPENGKFLLTVSYEENTSSIENNPLSSNIRVSQISEGIVEFLSTENTFINNIIINDITGKIISKFNLSSGSYTINLQKGIYIYSLIDDLNRTIGVYKFIVH